MKPSTLLPMLLGASLVFTGCATSPASYKSLSPSAAKIDFTRYDLVAVSVSPKPGVSLVAYEADRLRERIVEAIKASPQLAFKGFNPAEVQAGTLLLEVAVTRYEKGSAFARGMLIGLGQIHIRADVIVRDAHSKTDLSRFSVKKTFAWGGMYGASITIEDVERGFAAGVAAALAKEREKSGPRPGVIPSSSPALPAQPNTAE